MSDKETATTRLARPLAPEDLRSGQFVCIMHVMHEYIPFWCLEEATFREPEPVRLFCLAEEAGTPLRVVEVCVPFVLVEQPDGAHRTLDLRRHRLAGVSERFGERAFKRLRRSPATRPRRE